MYCDFESYKIVPGPVKFGVNWGAREAKVVTGEGARGVNLYDRGSARVEGNKFLKFWYETVQSEDVCGILVDQLSHLSFKTSSLVIANYEDTCNYMVDHKNGPFIIFYS